MRAAPHERRSRVFLRSVAIALSAPCIFYGLVGAGSTVILWTLIEPDFLRIDFHLSVLAAAGPIAFLLWVGRTRRVPGRRVAAGLQAATTARAAYPPSQRSRGARGAAYGWALALNVACIALALAVAAVRGRILGDASLTGVLALLVVAPALNVTVLLIERDG